MWAWEADLGAGSRALAQSGWGSALPHGLGSSQWGTGAPGLGGVGLTLCPAMGWVSQAGEVAPSARHAQYFLHFLTLTPHTRYLGHTKSASPWTQATQPKSQGSSLSSVLTVTWPMTRGQRPRLSQPSCPWGVSTPPSQGWVQAARLVPWQGVRSASPGAAHRAGCGGTEREVQQLTRSGPDNLMVCVQVWF